MLKVKPRYWKEETPRRVERALRAFRRIMNVAMGASYLADKEDLLFILLLITAIVDELANFIGEEVKEGEKHRTTVETSLKDPTDVKVTQEIVSPEK